MNPKLMRIVKIVFLPVVLIDDLLHSSRSTGAKCVMGFLVLVILGSVWIQAAYAGVEFIKYNLYQWGVTNRITSVNVIGTSMLPTIRSGDTVSLDSARKYIPERGDIVSFHNIETGVYSYIKRIIGTPGDVITIRNGRVLLNGQPLDESYTYKQLPTFGNTFISECQPVTVPTDSYLVLGDNRTVSMDSRVIGFVSRRDITGVIKTHQTIATSSDVSEREFELDVDEADFVQILNEKRTQGKHDPLVSTEPLERIAQKRAEQIRDHYDEWKTQSGNLESLLESEQYGYNLAHEYVTFGYLTEDDVIDQIFESFVEKELFLSDKYLEIGIGVAERDFNGCKYPVISVILSWPTTPSYDQATIEYWQHQDEVNSAILMKLNTYLSRPDQDQESLRTITDKTAHLAELSSRIASKMNKGEWLNSKDDQEVKSYKKNIDEVQALIKQSFSPEVSEDILSYIDSIATSEFSKSTLKAKDHYANGNYQEGLKEAHYALTIAKGTEEEAIAHYWIGLMNYRLNNPTVSESELNLAIKLKENYAAPYVTLSALRMDEGNFQEAYVLAQRAVKYDPDYAWAHNDLGLALSGLGRKQEAIAALKKAVELAPDSYVFRDNLTRVTQSP